MAAMLPEFNIELPRVYKSLHCVAVYWERMASIGSFCSGDAPCDFHLSPSLEDSGSRFSTSVEKCPLCCYNRGTFYCKQCIQEGSFIHSNNHYAERYRNEIYIGIIVPS